MCLLSADVEQNLNNKNLEIKFGGDLNEIDVDLFIESLVSYSSVTQETAAYLSPGIKVDIRIKAPRQGSFIIQLDLVAQMVGDIFARDNIALASEIVAIVGGLYGFKKWIARNGKPEVVKTKENNNIEVSNKNGNIVISNNVYNIYQENPRVRENLKKTFAKLKEKEEITDFSIRDVDTGEDIFYLEKKDFLSLSYDDNEAAQRKQKLIKEKQELAVFKIVFKENYKWEFFYQGTKIHAVIKDEVFFKKIEKGEIAFRSGDRLVVDLEIEQIFNEAANTFVNESYSILKVVEHIPRAIPIQKSFDFER
jgi:hypothetical protein